MTRTEIDPRFRETDMSVLRSRRIKLEFFMLIIEKIPYTMTVSVRRMIISFIEEGSHE